MERIKLLATIYDNNPTYENWRALLIAVTHNELITAGYPRNPTFRINDTEARKCFDSGMTPLQTFRETYEQ